MRISLERLLDSPLEYMGTGHASAPALGRENHSAGPSRAGYASDPYRGKSGVYRHCSLLPRPPRAPPSRSSALHRPTLHTTTPSGVKGISPDERPAHVKDRNRPNPAVSVGVQQPRSRPDEATSIPHSINTSQTYTPHNYRHRDQPSRHRERPQPVRPSTGLGQGPREEHPEPREGPARPKSSLSRFRKSLRDRDRTMGSGSGSGGTSEGKGI